MTLPLCRFRLTDLCLLPLALSFQNGCAKIFQYLRRRLAVSALHSLTFSLPLPRWHFSLLLPAHYPQRRWHLPHRMCLYLSLGLLIKLRVLDLA
ncbi:uncharacterized protein EV420DRAFT_1581241 [Desarmillaria tabescens]|uniref:Secreted protein n=1 Tax=Armillaria tabescens TaxID=1929756 RepID=A0AA39MNJ0_ARMTA|nr:uncharacterized protein EV420DRAFT_1581241 [Desarmillaria tabescens]KAK0440867.1 hypothetical protein EV420DRAFT_1581241 [Desarmillaria tabescens]